GIFGLRAVQERRIALKVSVGLVALCFRLCKLYLKRTRVYLRQQLAFADELAFLECNIVQLPIDTGFYRHIAIGRYVPQPTQINGNIGLRGRYCRYHDSVRSSSVVPATAAATAPAAPRPRVGRSSSVNRCRSPDQGHE